MPGSAPVPVSAARTISSSLMRCTFETPSRDRTSSIIDRMPSARNASAPAAGFFTAMPARIRSASVAASLYLSPSSVPTSTVAVGGSVLAARVSTFVCTSSSGKPFSIYSPASTLKCRHSSAMLAARRRSASTASILPVSFFSLSIV